MWDTLAKIKTTKNWQYTPLVTGKLFRLKHISNSTRTNDLRIVIGQSFEDDVQMFFNTYQVAFKPELEVFEFNQPGEFLERSIAIKRLDNLPDVWSIEIEALDAVFIPVTFTNLSLKFNQVKSSIMVGVL